MPASAGRALPSSSIRDADQDPDEAELIARADTGGFRESYAAVPESVAAVRAAVRAFAHGRGVPQSTIEAVTLAVSEAATNVVVHAYRDAEQPGQIDVAATLAASELRVTVGDSGSGLRPRIDSPGLGLGLAIIAQLADGVDLVKAQGGGLELRMRFALAAAGGCG